MSLIKPTPANVVLLGLAGALFVVVMLNRELRGGIFGEPEPPPPLPKPPWM